MNLQELQIYPATLESFFVECFIKVSADILLSIIKPLHALLRTPLSWKMSRDKQLNSFYVTTIETTNLIYIS